MLRDVARMAAEAVVELRRIALARDRLITGWDGAATIDELRKLDRYEGAAYAKKRRAFRLLSCGRILGSPSRMSVALGHRFAKRTSRRGRCVWRASTISRNELSALTDGCGVEAPFRKTNWLPEAPVAMRNPRPICLEFALSISAKRPVLACRHGWAWWREAAASSKRKSWTRKRTIAQNGVEAPRPIYPEFRASSNRPSKGDGPAVLACLARFARATPNDESKSDDRWHKSYARNAPGRALRARAISSERGNYRASLPAARADFGPPVPAGPPRRSSVCLSSAARNGRSISESIVMTSRERPR